MYICVCIYIYIYIYIYIFIYLYISIFIFQEEEPVAKGQTFESLAQRVLCNCVAALEHGEHPVIGPCVDG